MSAFKLAMNCGLDDSEECRQALDQMELTAKYNAVKYNNKKKEKKKLEEKHRKLKEEIELQFAEAFERAILKTLEEKLGRKLEPNESYEFHYVTK